MKNKSGRTIWFRRYLFVGVYPSTVEGFFFLMGAIAVGLGLGFGSTWLVDTKFPGEPAASVLPLLGLAGFALFPVVVIGAVVFAYRHSGPPN